MTVEVNSYTLKGTDGKHYILSSYLEWIFGVMRFMTLVIYGKGLFHTSYTTKAGKEAVKTSALGKHLAHLQHYVGIYSTEFTFSPLLRFFFEQYSKHAIRKYIPPLSGSDRFGIDLFNEFVDTMRKNATAMNLKKSVADWESKQRKQLDRVAEFEEELFQRHGRVVAVRLDLHYRKAIFTPSEIEHIRSESEKQNSRYQMNLQAGKYTSSQKAVEGRIALEEVQQDRKRMFANMKGKPSLFRHAVGYAWRIECGRAAGYHMHLFLFFNGAQVLKHEYLAQGIGEYWSNAITQGRGYFENCNRKKKEYEQKGSWALGEIEHWDAAKREKLKVALQYFCKTNQAVQVIPYPGCHLFHCGFFHRPRKASGGRPRVKGIGAATRPSDQSL